MDLDVVEKLLPQHEAQAYVYLLKNAPKKASDVAKELGIARPIAYKALESLEVQQLVIKHKASGKPAVYNPQHPLYLQKLLEDKKRETEVQKIAFDAALPSLISTFHVRFGGIPGFRIFVGKEGVTELYEDILNEGKDILLIRSLEDRKHPETTGLITPQMQAQVDAGLHVRSIDPYADTIPKNLDSYDAQYNINRRIVSPEKIATPAQILIYANKVSFISFGNVLVTTIIEDELIHKTFVSLFEYIWNSAETDDAKYRSMLHLEGAVEK